MFNPIADKGECMMKQGFRKPLRAQEIRKRKLLKEYEQKALTHFEQTELEERLEENLKVLREVLGDSG